MDVVFIIDFKGVEQAFDLQQNIDVQQFLGAIQFSPFYEHAL